MTLNVALHHRTAYKYDRLIALGPQVVRLRPAPHSRTPVLSYSLKIEPQPHFLNWQQDPHGNWLARLVFPERTDHFTVDVDLVADMAVQNPFDFFLEPYAQEFPFKYEDGLLGDLAPFMKPDPVGPELKLWLAEVDRTKMGTVDFLVAVNQRLQQDIGYIIRLEPGVQSCETTLARTKGSCRDTGWLLVQILRNLGFAARFVSGYLIQLVADQKALDGPSGTTVDFTDLHAWTEVYLPGAGWIGFDPTSGLMTGEGHIPLAATPAPQSAAPVEGLIEEAEVEFHHEMKVTRILESARTTKPYADDMWARIEALGHAVDAHLEKGDVRLTMGGEPTFVSVDDMEGAEWNTAALGLTKRRLAGQLLKRLRKLWSPGALLHYGQGKWYPGEQLPRWALGCFWRKDGEPIWRDASLQADDTLKTNVGFEHAERFAERLCERLGIPPMFAQRAYEDAWYYLWREQRLPVNVDPLKSNLKDPEERARLAGIFEKGLDNPVGMALPITRGWQGGPRKWSSGFWFVRQQDMFLIPGDSPMGFRLPLDSLPWTAPGDYPYHWERDPFDSSLPPLPARDPRERALNVPGGNARRGYAPQDGIEAGPGGVPLLRARKEHDDLRQRERSALRPQKSATGMVRTAMCIEPRDGLLHVFMPPVPEIKDYLDLVVQIENTAADLRLPVLIEGYAPPSDPRIANFSVTPDPGVIEVNVHPASNWSEMVDRTTALYEEARQTRLASEKFMVDGRHVGTGGGNHFVLGGETPAQSPWLRRPDLLGSMLRFWHNHPALSYLFSGLFIGPTSQHPRIDEARKDQVHELEMALAQLPAKDTAGIAPWLVDRVLRNVLVDVTGNTHRTEFCIDKLFSPDHAGGRRGLVELRAFEMPPHARMSLVQQLLLRSLVAHFWEEPYTHRLARWGNAVHDKFMLPHFVREDMCDVLETLRDAGYGFEDSWFDPHFEFRFPKLGEAAYRGVDIELRHALEPWHVLGEEAGPGGTVRYVDSSLERLQVRVRNLVDQRHVLSCNGIRVPLHPTGVDGEFVAGVRFRAWNPSSALHPTVPVHAPLVFDLVDSWNKRSIGGCTYHVVHPGGRNYDRFPVNANEAEARRRARFFRIGHTPGSQIPHVLPTDPDFPLTLDLRRVATQSSL